MSCASNPAPEYKALIAAFHDRFQPTIPDECVLVDMLIRSEWLLRRYTSIETAVWEQDIRGSHEPFVGDTYLKSQAAFERVGKRMNWAQRNFQFALKQLLDIRAKRAHDQGTADPEPAVVSEIEPEFAPEPAAPEPETEQVNPKLVSFLPRAPQSPAPNKNTPPADPEPEENPPTAA